MWDGWYDGEPDYEEAILARQDQQDIDEDNLEVDFDEYRENQSYVEWLAKFIGDDNGRNQ